MQNRKEEFEKFYDIFEQKNLKKNYTVIVLGQFVFNYDFVDILKGFLKEDVERRDTIGVVYSDEFDQSDEEYFGENKVLFYYGIDEEWEDIVTHEELCEYLQTACEFYIGKNPEKKEIIEELLMKIKEQYNIK
ncbi:ribonuclease toxin immunity protein CdiI [Bacillus sp. FJAT-51639]|uniref:Ribonuclease toxin immunity protein CdiI n=1 Tax=Bacillus bruguierae TaxID=3127667 RepID=A0ABU8FL45_9BACI